MHLAPVPTTEETMTSGTIAFLAGALVFASYQGITLWLQLRRINREQKVPDHHEQAEPGVYDANFDPRD